MAAPKEYDPNVAADADTTGNEVGTLAAVFDPPEVEVGKIEEVIPPQQAAGADMVVVRIGSEGVEEMSYNKNRYTFEPGHQYRVPRVIAAELDRIGKLWH